MLSSSQIQALSIGCYGYFYTPQFSSNVETTVVEKIELVLKDSVELFASITEFQLNTKVESVKKVFGSIVQYNSLDGIIQSKSQELFGILTEE